MDCSAPAEWCQAHFVEDLKEIQLSLLSVLLLEAAAVTLQSS